jgi:hypothetical protein
VIILFLLIKDGEGGPFAFCEWWRGLAASESAERAIEEMSEKVREVLRP